MGTSDKTAHGYVCIPEGALTELRIEHLTSAIDMSVGLPQSVVDLAPNAISGYTEWVATWRGADVSLGWDWAYARGQILMLHPEEIRTNIQLIAPDGTARTAVAARLRLARWLEPLPWREGAIRELIQRNGSCPR